ADVGWEAHEMIHRVKKGRNHGWSIKEGSQTVKQDLQPKIPITPPLFEHTRRDSRSISGGHFWQSDRIPELKGAYIYGDWMTGKVWALKHKGDQVLWHQELVDTPLQVISFLLDPSGEVLILAYDGTILRLEPNTEAADQKPFPTKLSQTGVFSDVLKQEPSPGVVEYQISAPHWADGTQSRQWIAVPESQQLGLYKKDDYKIASNPGRFRFPEHTVLAKTVSYLTVAGDSQSERRIETQLLHRYLDDWRAYNYIWNDDQTEAVLQDDVGIDRKLLIKDPTEPGGLRSQTWRHSARSECLLCHAWGVGAVHAFWPEQLNIQVGQGNQLERFAGLGLFSERIPAKSPPPSPHDTTQSLEDRARAYLSLNCATCHRKLGGGTANFNFDLTKTFQENNYIDQPPAQGSFGLANARVVAPGDPLRSVLIYRMLKSGRGHMPQFGCNVTDIRGIRVMHDWIASLPAENQTSTKIRAAIESLPAASAPEQRISSLLASTSGAMALSLLCSDESIQDDLKTLIIKQGTADENPLVRDLFEHYLPEDQRVKRLGPTVDTETLLAQEGSAKRGKQLFEEAKDVNCRACHRIGSVGAQVGPDLNGIGTQQRPDEILASVLKPSEKIDSKFRGRTILTADGKVLTGIVTQESKEQISLVDSAGKTLTLATDDIEDMQPSAKSAMPDQLLSGMTMQQAADLIAFLSAQDKIGPLQHKHATITRAKEPIDIDGKRDESAWKSAKSVGDFVFTWWKEGDAERQQTDARMLWDDQYLYVSFRCEDKNIQATRVERDDAVYRDDCVEVFASPEFEHPERYFNLEMNALGTQLDEYRPHGSLDKPLGWNPDGIQVAVSVDGTVNDDSDVDRCWTLEAAIPFKLFRDVLPVGRPKAGDRWRLNLNRLDRNMLVKSQWSQGDRNFPRFHHPAYFGFVEFTR
ncbi:MAG: carbohydrate-binding family 9-like protein, partial [Rubripirellula sp.]